MAVLEGIQPVKVFRFFEEICAIPHPSYKEKLISDYLVKFAKDRGLEVYQDELYNVVIVKEASAGYEQLEPVILQGHMDMVCEKAATSSKDMEKEGLDLVVDGDFIFAQDTTLGGDDGIAIAFALALLDDKEAKHPRIEFVCTVSEEVGMEGARGIDLSMLKGKRLINIDSEEEGFMLASCAGGCSLQVEASIDKENCSGDSIEVHIRQLTGGHSGTEIHKERGNSNILMARMLRQSIQETQTQLQVYAGGQKDNAIPRDTKACWIVPKGEGQRIVQLLSSSAREIEKEFQTSDPDMKIEIVCSSDVTAEAVTAKDTKRILGLVSAMPNGVIRQSVDIPQLVETSLNLGICSLEESFVLRYALRSSVGSAKEALLHQMEFIAEAFQASTTVSGMYPAWEYRKDSPLREKMISVYETMFGKKPVIQAIHAGLECGILSEKIKDLDCVSMGPDIFDIHTTEERLSISSSKRMYEYLVELLASK